MKKTLFLCLLLGLTFSVRAEQSDLDSLNHYIALKGHYDAEREARIAALMAQVPEASDRYEVYAALFDEYKSYNYDEAILYVEKLYDEAITQGNVDRICRAQIERGFALLSAGLFKESCDLMERLDTTGVQPSTRQYYCLTHARLLLDLAGYNHTGEAHAYQQQAVRLFKESVSFLTPADTAEYWYIRATIDAQEGKTRSAIERMGLSLEDTRISEHQRAINYSTMAYLYHDLGDEAMQLHYNILAAIADIRSSTKETVAMRNVAEWLYRHGQTTVAGTYIREAQADANCYNARHRQLEISQILPIIEQENYEQEKRLNRQLIFSEVVALLLLLGMVALVWMLIVRLKELKHARLTIQRMNDSLQESNKIRTAYIGNLLCQESELIGEMEKYQEFVRRNVQDRHYQELLTVPRQYAAHKQRELFYKRFDEMFVGIFPHFVEDFNSLLRPDQQITLKKDELLNTELRIAALIRLGIHHNEVISEVLNYSVNTIYTYKTKLRARSNYSLQELQERLMSL